MLVAALTFALLFQPAPDFNALAKARDADGLLAVSGPEVQALDKPFQFLKANGPYGTGRFGWTAIELNAPSGDKYVVFSTKITSQDYGEFVFQVANGKLTRYLPEPDSLGFRIDHQTMDIRFELGAKSTSISTVVRFRRTGSERPGFFIRMSPQYRVTSVFDESKKSVPFAQSGGVTWIRSAGKPDFSYRINYKGVVDLPQYAGSISTKEVLLTNDYWYPMIARLPQTYEATIRTLRDWTAVAQGDLQSETIEGDEKVTKWKMDLPAVYWSLSAGPFKVVADKIHGRMYKVWSFRMSEDAMHLQNELYAPIIEWFDKNLAPYPFSAWGAIDSPAYGGGALEAYSFATYGGGLPSEDGHETGHTWFGGIINNTYFNSLWNESFAVYVDGLVDREMEIGNRLERRVAFVDEAFPDPSYAQRPMSDSGVFRGPVASSLGYGKGAKVLQMLEIELGTPAMIAAMNYWLKNHPKGEPGNWEDFERAVKASSGKDLKRFFDEWVRRPGWANFEVQNVRWENGKVLGEAVFKGDAYHLLTEVMLQAPSGGRTFATVRFEPVNGKASFSFDAPEKPTLVSFDPWRKLLRNSSPDERPADLNTAMARMRIYAAPSHAELARFFRGANMLQEVPADLNGVLLVGSPETVPAMRPLCEKVGFQVSGNKLTYEGTTIDLTQGSALALVDLEGGGRCVIALGNIRRRPNPGRARLVLTDSLGRFVRGKTEPKTAGPLSFKL